MEKRAVLFPGIGYHCDKPLLYYCGKLLQDEGYQVIKLKYVLPDLDIKNNHDQRMVLFEEACLQTQAQLCQYDLNDAQELIFVGKSIGCYVAAKQRVQTYKKAKLLLLTPLMDTLTMNIDGAVIFSGLEDPWVNPAILRQKAQEQDVKLIQPHGNHSLEVKGNYHGNLKRIEEVLDALKEMM